MTELVRMVASKEDKQTRQCIKEIPIDGINIPLWQVENMYGFVKLIGHAKYLNREYGRVLLRGQCIDYKSMKPAAYRSSISRADADARVTEMVSILKRDKGLNAKKQPTPNIQSFVKCFNPLVYEAILQHYCFETRLLDVLDNIWVTLWFASHRRMKDEELCPDYSNCKQCHESARYVESTGEYSYVYLIGIPAERGQCERCGIEEGKKHCLIDIRRACPSTILRPHMQHGLVIGFYDKKRFKESYAEQIIAIIRIKTQNCLEWLRNDKTLTPSTLFPCPMFDEMYKMILKTRKDLFETLNQEWKTGEVL